MAGQTYSKQPHGPDSWVEIASEPSSSSLSSAANDGLEPSGPRLHRHPPVYADARGSAIRPRRRSHRAAVRSPHRRIHDRSAAGLFALEADGSSQEDGYEGENESDRVMASSSEMPAFASARNGTDAFGGARLAGQEYSSTLSGKSSRSTTEAESGQADGESDADYDNADLLDADIIPDPVAGFTPAPHAFSQPSLLMVGRGSEGHTAPSLQRAHVPSMAPHSQPYQGSSKTLYHRHQHSPYNIITPAHQVDHDAALRASLSTLLTCAAAARNFARPPSGGDGVPVNIYPSKETQRKARQPSSHTVVTHSLRIVPESALFGEEASLPAVTSAESSNTEKSARSRNATATKSTLTASKTLSKRKRAVGQDGVTTSAAPEGPSNYMRTAKSSRSSSGNADLSTKNARPSGNAQLRSTASMSSSMLEDAAHTDLMAASAALNITPTLLTWVLSAGVLVLVSAITFSAGFVVGRESAQTDFYDIPRGSGYNARGVASAYDAATDAATSTCRPQPWSKAFGLRRLRWMGSGTGLSSSMSVAG